VGGTLIFDEKNDKKNKSTDRNFRLQTKSIDKTNATSIEEGMQL